MAALLPPSEVEKLREEVAHWKALYEEQLRKTQTLVLERIKATGIGITLQTLERRLRGETIEEQKPAAPNQRRQKAAKARESELMSKADGERDRVKNKLRLACSQNDASLLREAIAEAERLGMPEVEYARKKLATISS